MSANVGVFPGRRLTNVYFTTNHAAGDLVYVNGFYGVVEDAIVVATDHYGTLIITEVHRLPRVASTVAMGTVLAAPATEMATTLPLLTWAVNGASAGINATAGWNPVGKVTTTGNASMALVRLTPDKN